MVKIEIELPDDVLGVLSQFVDDSGLEEQSGVTVADVVSAIVSDSPKVMDKFGSQISQVAVVDDRELPIVSRDVSPLIAGFGVRTWPPPAPIRRLDARHHLPLSCIERGSAAWRTVRA